MPELPIRLALLISCAVLFSQPLGAQSPAAPIKTSPWEKITVPAVPHGSTFGLCMNPQNGTIYLNYTPGQGTKVLEDGGLYVSKDHGDTWTKSTTTPIIGRGETGYWCSVARPFTGTMVLWTIDGPSIITSDGCATWKMIGRQGRGFDFGDVDWSAGQPRTFFALEHEPYYRVLSTDGGATWKRLDPPADQASFRKNKKWYPRLGVVNATTLVSTDGVSTGILYSDDLGANWTRVSDFQPLAAHPIRYGQRLFWASTAGVIVSGNGRDWSLLGDALPNATFGPFFCANDQELLVVTTNGVYRSRDGARTWSKAAPLPPGYWLGSGKQLVGIYCEWDPASRIFYFATRLGMPCYRLHLP
jgi:hypothetical protein